MDSEKIIITDNDEIEFKEDKLEDVNDLLKNVNKRINYKLAILLFISFIILNTDMFIKVVLSNFMVEKQQSIELNNNGILIVGSILSLLSIIYGVLIDRNIL